MSKIRLLTIVAAVAVFLCDNAFGMLTYWPEVWWTITKIAAMCAVVYGTWVACRIGDAVRNWLAQWVSDKDSAR